MSKKKRIRLAGPELGAALSKEESLALMNLVDYGRFSQRDAEESGLGKRPWRDIIAGLVAKGHAIYLEVDLAADGSEVAGTEVWYYEDCSFNMARRLGTPYAVEFPDPNIDFPDGDSIRGV